ncbi:pimeloyl-ACP methyl ester carboxylesterase [Jatrophihabitans sp. GAS493]|uniref:alpha/beta fold hydrolase n=1 Tax=Jatrophihabitans sp. GAS493 TaxID=1907575 RepID=UPI000BB84E04|nr:alpha/beta hydrolase [Jatrophihabitans sp. GAS493]SOD71000.1 pimeloyl-ACP methyl ester carboxylesterase [Jatrophihabitans sp. GAS493]
MLARPPLGSFSCGLGAPILVLPWFGLDGTVTAAAIEPAFERVARSGNPGNWRRLYLDLPGTGDSDPVAPTSDAVLDAIEETVETLLGDAPLRLIGCSYGGYLAAGLARRRPAQVRAMLLVCSGVRIDPLRRDLSGVLASDPEPEWLATVPPALQEHFRVAVGNQQQLIADRLTTAFATNAPTDEDYLMRLRATGYPLSDEASDRIFDGSVALITGRRDRIAGFRDQFSLLERFPQASYGCLARAGHYLPFEEAEQFAGLLGGWLA